LIVIFLFIVKGDQLLFGEILIYIKSCLSFVGIIHQTYVNWRLKSTKALSIYSIALTGISEVAYSVHIFSSDIATALKFSAIIAALNEIILLFQVWYYNDRSSYWLIAIITSITAGILATLYFAYQPSDIVIHVSGFVFISINMIRLIPQMVLNWQRKSTHGYSIVRLLVLTFNSSLLLISALLVTASIHIILNNVFKLFLRSIMLMQHVAYGGTFSLAAKKHKSPAQ